MSKHEARPIVLIIRDGWGANPYPEWNHANAVHLARTTTDDRLRHRYPHTLLHTAGGHVGLPEGVMGNSEVGHQNIGAGRVVEQEIMRITRRIRDGSFFSNEALVSAFSRAHATGGNVHIMGLCSDGRVHSDLDHLYGLLEMSGRCSFPGHRVFVHAFTDGRDTLPHNGVRYLEAIEHKCRALGINPVASVVGRYFAMDRDGRWDRIEKAYRLLTIGEGRKFRTALEALRHYYYHPAGPNRSGDEFVAPSVIETDQDRNSRIGNGDSVIFFNFRGDRPRQLCKAFTCEQFPYEGEDRDGNRRRIGFQRGPKLDLHFVTMTAYSSSLSATVALPKPPKMADILGAYMSALDLKQFRCAETEKYAHVTFFFNDYRDEPFPGEERTLIASPQHVATYDQKPEMSAFEVTAAVLDRLAHADDDLIVINYANGDMVGHTGDLQAAIRAVETVDECVGRVVDAVQKIGGGLVVTADHGNCEQMIDPETEGPHTAHTTYDVECILVDERYVGRKLRAGGGLADIAPTLLEMLGADKPEAMTGSSLIAPE